MRRHLLPLFTLVIATLACNSIGLSATAGSPKPTAMPSEAPDAQPTSAVPAAGGLEINPLPSAGRLAVQGDDGNLYILEQNKPPLAVSKDATPFDQNGRGLIYTHPTWSPQGWLSFVRDNTSGDSVQLELVALPPDLSKPLTVLSQPDDNYIYGYWSPAACTSGNSCGRLAFLMGSGDQVALHLAEVTHDSLTSENAIGLASPFYFSWSPDGNDMLWHRNTTDLTVYDAQHQQIGERLPDTGGTFQSPAWSPADNRLLFARAEHDTNQLTIAQDKQRSDLGAPAGQPFFFNWSPDGDYVASAVGDYPLSGLTIRRADGSSTRQIKELDIIVGFFWSPDGSQLAVVTAESKGKTLPQASRATRLPRVAEQGTTDVNLVWSLVDVASGKVTRLGTFFPTPEEFYVLRYFDQYSQSHRVWSPDGRYLVYAELRSDASAPVISLLDTLAPGKAPIELMQGAQAIYSFGP